MSLYEYEATIPTLWKAVKGYFQSSSVFTERGLTRPLEFIDTNPGLVSPDNAMAFLSDDGGESYNRCHCAYNHARFYSKITNLMCN